MARSTFGGTTDDSVEAIRTVAGQKVSSPQANVLVTFWSAKTGGTQYTDLLLNSVATTAITSDANGILPEFSGPDGIATMWADAGGDRVIINTNSGPTDAGVAGYIGTPGSATNAALKTSFVPVAAKAPQDSMRGTRDRALRSWDALMADPGATPGLMIYGHSVIAGTGASVQPRTCARILKSRAESVHYGTKVGIRGMPGNTTTQMIAAGLPSEFTSMPAGSVGCLVLMCMLNDYTSGILPATTASNIQTLISNFRADAAAAPNMSVVIGVEWKRLTASGGYTWPEYVAAAQGVADADTDVTVVDLSTRLGDASSDTQGLFSDGTHPNDRGHGLVADLLASELFRSTTRRVIYPDHTELSALVPPLTTSGTWTPNVISSTAGFGNVIISSGGTAAGDSITYSFFGESGIYDITLSHQRRADAGQYDLYIDGVLQGSGNSWDGYAASTGYVAQKVSGFTIKTSGRHTFELRISTRNASNTTGWKGSICGIGITRTGDLTS